MLFESPGGVHFGAEALTMLASKPPPPLPPTEDGEEPPAEEAEPRENVVVPLTIELVRISTPYVGRPGSTGGEALGGLTMGATGLGGLGAEAGLTAGAALEVVAAACAPDAM